jgi:hypothetical protein
MLEKRKKERKKEKIGSSSHTLLIALATLREKVNIDSFFTYVLYEVKYSESIISSLGFMRYV